MSASGGAHVRLVFQSKHVQSEPPFFLGVQGVGTLGAFGSLEFRDLDTNACTCAARLATRASLVSGFVIRVLGSGFQDVGTKAWTRAARVASSGAACASSPATVSAALPAFPSIHYTSCHFKP